MQLYAVCGVAAWHNGSTVGHINEVTLCWARSVLEWLAIFTGHTTSVPVSIYYVTKSPLLSLLPLVGWKRSTRERVVKLYGG